MIGHNVLLFIQCRNRLQDRSAKALDMRMYMTVRVLKAAIISCMPNKYPSSTVDCFSLPPS